MSATTSLLGRVADLSARIPYPIRSVTKATVVTVQIACLLHLLTDRIGFIQECKGESMLPTLAPEGDWIVFNRLPFFLTSRLAANHVPFAHPFGRGDLVIASHPLLPERTVGKRIIAMGGDTVEINPAGLRPGRGGAGGGEAERERGGAGEYLRVPPGHVWLQGDNLSNSTDSRDYGPVPLALVLARVEGRVWPTPTRFRNALRWLDA